MHELPPPVSVRAVRIPAMTCASPQRGALRQGIRKVNAFWANKWADTSVEHGGEARRFRSRTTQGDGSGNAPERVYRNIDILHVFSIHPQLIAVVPK
jgi:hypothetical protein